MRILDVTLRDGGFVCDFDWGLETAKNHIKQMSQLKLDTIEVGYWGQTSKSQNPFYNLDIDFLSSLAPSFSDTSKCAAMIDFHYCPKSISDYPKAGETRLDMLRLTSRKQDIEEATVFAQKLKHETGLLISYQIINSTNYSRSELTQVVRNLVVSGVDIIAFADSHGNLNLFNDYERYSEALDILKDNNVESGFHLHNHTGRALSNYLILQDKKINYIDASVRGLGKGLGNLKLEEIVRNEDLAELLEYISSSRHNALNFDRLNCFRMLTGRANVTDNYALDANKYQMSMQDFYVGIKALKGRAKDSYDPTYFSQKFS